MSTIREMDDYQRMADEMMRQQGDACRQQGIAADLRYAQETDESRQQRAALNEITRHLDIAMGVIRQLGTPDDLLEIANAAQLKAAEVLTRSKPILAGAKPQENAQ